MQKKKIWLLVLAILLILIISNILLPFQMTGAEGDPGPKIAQGKLHLHNKVLATDGPFELNGDWEFYWQELLVPEDAQRLPVHPPHLVTVPDTWSNYTLNGESLPKYGFATYRLTIFLNDAEEGQMVSLYMPSIATAYRLWVNDELVASNGVVGQSRTEMIPENYPQIVTFVAERPKIELLLHVSDFHQRKAGVWESITFGTAEQITPLREKNILFQAVVIGSIFMIGCYHLVLFLRRPREYSPLFLAIACFAVALRTLLLKDTLFIYLLPQISWEVAVRLEYVSALIAFICFLFFVRRELLVDIPNKVVGSFVTVIIGYMFFVLVTPAYMFTNTFVFFQLLAFSIMSTIVIVSFISVKRQLEGAYLHVVAILFLFAAILNDLFYYSQWISTDEFVSLGLLFYLFTQSIHLARRFSRSFDKVERLSEELQEFNHSLERKVEKRTEELQEANHNLQKMEQSRRRLLASVSHELNTPLTFIQGYIKAMMDGVVSKDDSTYLRTVYSDTQMMAHMIRDLQDLSKLESRQVTFQYEGIDIRSFLAQLSREQKPVIQEKGFHFQYKEKLRDTVTGAQVICFVDPVRLKQAYLNLIMNAQKFTQAGGTITVEVEIPAPENEEEVKVSVVDTGSGIAEVDVPFIFERFYKVNRSESGEDRGAGLGLAIVKEIIEQHKGSVGVHSEQGQGSLFFFTLPIHRLQE